MTSHEFVITPAGITRAEIETVKQHMREQPMGSHKLQIYLAGHLAEADFFYSLHELWPEFAFCSSWVGKIFVENHEDNWQNVMINWPINISEAAGADVVLVHGF